jgi:hypothetical protein
MQAVVGSIINLLLSNKTLIRDQSGTNQFHLQYVLGLWVPASCPFSLQVKLKFVVSMVFTRAEDIY